MKKLLLPLLLVLAIGMLSAVESDPSNVVGYVKYEIGVGNNFVAIPMECPWTWAGEDLGASFAGNVDQVSWWDPAAQDFLTASDLGFMWLNDYEIDTNYALMLYAYADADFYSIGDLPADPAEFNLVAGNTSIMVPLNRSDLGWAGEIGAEMVAGGVDQISMWDPLAQDFLTASDLGFMWLNDFEVDIAMPLIVYSYAAITWPVRSSQNQIRNSKNN